MNNVVPIGWKLYELKDVALKTDRHSFTGGPFGSNLKSEDYTDYGVRIIQLQNIGDGEFKNKYKIFTSPEKADELSSCNIFPNDIILSKMGDPVARATIIPSFDNRYVMASDGIRLAVDKSRFDTKFIHDTINAQAFRGQAELSSTGSTRKRIGLTELRSLTLVAPPLPEQKKIATIMSSVDNVIEKTRAQIDKLKDLKTGMMQELLTKGIGHTEFKSSDVGQIPKSWACDLVSSLFEIQLGKMLSQAAKVGASPMPYLGNKDVQWGKINVTDLQTMDFSEREREKFLLKPGDLLMCEGGEVGRSAIWEGELKECYYQKAIHRLRPIDDAYEPRLLLEYMRYAKGQNLLADFISQTSIAHLTREKLSAIPIPVPPVAEQKKIVDIITSIDTRINRHLDKLKNTYDIKKALMQDLLTGKVRVNLNESAAL